MMKMIQYFNPFMLSGLFCLKSLDRSISSRRSVWLLLFLPSSIKIHAFIANSVDPDQMLHSAASRMQHLIQVYPVCQCPFYGMLGINELSLFQHYLSHTDGGIMKTCLYNTDLIKPHFYIVKLGFTVYTLFFLFLLKNIGCGYSLEPPCQGSSKECPQSMF